jgi:heat shock protein HtpX
MDNLFSTHPSTENRIAALEQLAQEMGVPRDEGPDGLAHSTTGPWAHS